MIRGTSEKFSLIWRDEKWTSGGCTESKLVQSNVSYRIAIPSYHIVSYRIVSRGAAARASALLFEGKRTRGVDEAARSRGGNPRPEI